MKSFLTIFASTALVTSAHAATFSPDSATASSEFNSGYLAVNSINGTGMPVGFDGTSIHDTYAFGNHWTTSPGTDPLDASITWSFTSGATIGGIYFWNHLSNSIAANPGYDVTLFDLTFLDASNSILKAFDDIAMTPNTAGASEAFTLASPLSGVFGVRFDVEGVESSPNYTGLAEVLFSDAVIANAVELEPSVAAVPLPAGLPLLLAGLGALGLARRTRS